MQLSMVFSNLLEREIKTVRIFKEFMVYRILTMSHPDKAESRECNIMINHNIRLCVMRSSIVMSSTYMSSLLWITHILDLIFQISWWIGSCCRTQICRDQS